MLDDPAEEGPARQARGGAVVQVELAGLLLADEADFDAEDFGRRWATAAAAAAAAHRRGRRWEYRCVVAIFLMLLVLLLL